LEEEVTKHYQLTSSSEITYDRSENFTGSCCGKPIRVNNNFKPATVPPSLEEGAKRLFPSSKIQFSGDQRHDKLHFGNILTSR